MSNLTILRQVAKISSNLAEDMYCRSTPEVEGGERYWDFFLKPRYKNGTVIKKITANSPEYLPKLAVWDWKGDPEYNIPPTRLIIIRGTGNNKEWSQNFDFQEKTGEELGLGISGYFHRGFALSAIKTFDVIEPYITQTDLPVVIMGHSRGASVAQITTVLAKSRLTRDQIYCLAFAPAPSMNLTEHPEVIEKLTSGIYGFATNFDPIPHFFVEEVIDTFCFSNPGVCEEGNVYLDTIIDYCEIFYNCSYLIALAAKYGHIFMPELAPILRTLTSLHFYEGLLEQADLIIYSLYDYFNGTLDIHIKQHVGTVVQLYWANISSNEEGTSGLRMRLDKAMSDPEKFPTIRRIGGMKMSIFDHHKQWVYRHAIEDIACEECKEFGLLNPNGPPVNGSEHPGWLPSFGSANYVLESSPSDESGFFDFMWESSDTGKRCYGKSVDSDPTSVSEIVAVSCTSASEVCVYELGTYECHDINRTKPSLEDRCYVYIPEELDDNLMFGLSFGIPSFVVVLVVLIIIVCCLRKKKDKNEEEASV